MNPRFETYPRKRRGRPPKIGEEIPPTEYGWRFRSGNAQISAVSGEGFTRREDAQRAVKDFLAALRYTTDGDGPPLVHLESEEFRPEG